MSPTTRKGFWGIYEVQKTLLVVVTASIHNITPYQLSPRHLKTAFTHFVIMAFGSPLQQMFDFLILATPLQPGTTCRSVITTGWCNKSGTYKLYALH